MIESVKQKNLQLKRPNGRWAILFAGLCFIGISGPSAAYGTKRSSEPVADLRLIAASDPVEGAYRTALVITMASGSHTYWSSPGEAGVPPVMTLTGSTNLARATLAYPPPSRLEEDGLEAFGYTDRIAFPLSVTPTDTGKPIVLRVDFAFAVCNKICVPAHATAEVALPAAVFDNAAVAAAYAALPTALPSLEGAALQLEPIPSAGKQRWSVAWHGKMPLHDVFAEAPEGFSFETKATGAGGDWILVADQATKTGPVPLTLTLVGENRSFVTTRTLDVRATSP